MQSASFGIGNCRSRYFSLRLSVTTSLKIPAVANEKRRGALSESMRLPRTWRRDRAAFAQVVPMTKRDQRPNGCPLARFSRLHHPARTNTRGLKAAAQLASGLPLGVWCAISCVAFARCSWRAPDQRGSSGLCLLRRSTKFMAKGHDDGSCHP